MLKRIQPARQRKPHGPGAKPQRSVAVGRRAGRTTALRAHLAHRGEATLMHLVARLSADVHGDITARNAHGYFVNGFCAAMEAFAIVPPARIAVLRTACDALLDGALTLQDVRAMKASPAAPDATYVRAITAARRAGTVDAAHLADALGVGLSTARTLVERMQADGLISEPDMFGVRTIRTEVSHA
jgi:hypothetical protein